MNYANIRNGFFYSIMVLSFMYVIFCIFDDKDPKKIYNKEFAKTLSRKLRTVKELDDLELKKIQIEIDKILNAETKLKSVAKKSVVGAIKGGMTGCLVGGMEGALAGGIVFGTITPVIMMVENMI